MPLFSPSPPHIHTPPTHTTTQPLPTYLPWVALISSYVKSKKERFILEQRTLFPRGFWIRTHHPAITRKLRMHIYLYALPCFSMYQQPEKATRRNRFLSHYDCHCSSCQNVGSTRSYMHPVFLCRSDRELKIPYPCNEGFLLTHILVNKMQKIKNRQNIASRLISLIYLVSLVSEIAPFS